MGMTREHISLNFDSRNMLLSRHIGVSFVKATVVCAILERISDSEPLFAPRNSKLVTVLAFIL